MSLYSDWVKECVTSLSGSSLTWHTKNGRWVDDKQNIIITHPISNILEKFCVLTFFYVLHLNIVQHHGGR